MLSPRANLGQQSGPFSQHRRVQSQVDGLQPPSNHAFQQNLKVIRGAGADQTSRMSGRNGSVSSTSGYTRHASTKPDVTNPITGGPLTSRF